MHKAGRCILGGFHDNHHSTLVGATICLPYDLLVPKDMGWSTTHHRIDTSLPHIQPVCQRRQVGLALWQTWRLTVALERLCLAQENSQTQKEWFGHVSNVHAHSACEIIHLIYCMHKFQISTRTHQCLTLARPPTHTRTHTRTHVVHTHAHTYVHVRTLVRTRMYTCTHTPRTKLAATGIFYF